MDKESILQRVEDIAYRLSSGGAGQIDYGTGIVIDVAEGAVIDGDTEIGFADLPEDELGDLEDFLQDELDEMEWKADRDLEDCGIVR